MRLSLELVFAKPLRLMTPVLLLATVVSVARSQNVIPGAAGNGSTDDTLAIQTAINALPSNGTLDGGGVTYLVGTLNLKSHMTFQNFNLKTRPSNIPLTAVT